MTLIRVPSGAVTSTVSGDVARTRPMSEKFGTATFVSSNRAERIAAALMAGDEPITTAWASMLATYTLAEPVEQPYNNPFQVPNDYTYPTEAAAVILPFRYGAIRAYNFALRYAVTGDEAAATAAAAHLEPWSHITGWIQGTGDGTRLVWAYTFPIMLAAASMIEGSAAMTPTLRADLEAVAAGSLTIPGSIAFSNTNNQGDWGVLLYMAVGAFTGDSVVFDTAVARWKTILEASVNSNGDLWDEIYRQGGGQGNGSSGLYYSTFALGAKTFAAEVARVNGVWLYDYESPSGHTLRGVWERIAAWLAAPATYPYNSSGTPTGPLTENIAALEILQALWPLANGASALSPARPIFERYGAPYGTATHPGLRVAG